MNLAAGIPPLGILGLVDLIPCRPASANLPSPTPTPQFTRLARVPPWTPHVFDLHHRSRVLELPAHCLGQPSAAHRSTSPPIVLLTAPGCIRMPFPSRPPASTSTARYPVPRPLLPLRRPAPPTPIHLRSPPDSPALTATRARDQMPHNRALTAGPPNHFVGWPAKSTRAYSPLTLIVPVGPLTLAKARPAARTCSRPPCFPLGSTSTTALLPLRDARPLQISRHTVRPPRHRRFGDISTDCPCSVRAISIVSTDRARAPQVSFNPSFKLITFWNISFTRLHCRRTM